MDVMSLVGEPRGNTRAAVAISWVASCPLLRSCPLLPGSTYPQGTGEEETGKVEYGNARYYMSISCTCLSCSLVSTALSPYIGLPASPGTTSTTHPAGHSAAGAHALSLLASQRLSNHGPMWGGGYLPIGYARPSAGKIRKGLKGNERASSLPTINLQKISQAEYPFR